MTQLRHEEFMKQMAMQEDQFPSIRKSKEYDAVTRPSHYNIGGIEPAEFMESLGIAEDYYAGNIIKYIARYKHKNGIEDVRKAKQYTKMLLELLESNPNDRLL